MGDAIVARNIGGLIGLIVICYQAFLHEPYDVGTTSMRSPRATSMAGISDAGRPMRYARMQRMTEACPMMSRSSFSRSSSIKVGSRRTAEWMEG